MATFLFAYRAPKNYNPGSPETVAAWTSWFEGMGTNVLSRGNGVFKRSTLGNCATDSVLGGYSLITADDLDTAMTFAAGCPFLRSGGGIEVGELAPPPAPTR
jgi:hypothetical protein